MTAFDADTGIERAGPGRWRGDVSERWFVGRGPNGGLIAAQAVRAMEALVDDPERVPRSLTVHYLEAPVAGPVELVGTVEREGRSTTAVSLRIEQSGRTVALALGALAVWRDGGLDHLDTAPPSVPPPDEAPALRREDVPGLPAFTDNYEYRWAAGEGAGGARVGGWIRVPGGGRPVDHVALAAFSDAFPPAVFPLLGGRTAFAPTIDLTIHFRAPITAPAAPSSGGGPTGRAPLDAFGSGWVLGAFRSRRVAGGFFEEDGELWSGDGVLLAQSRQLAMLREPR